MDEHKRTALHFAAAKVEPKRKLVEFRVSEDNMLDVGMEIIAAHYMAGQYVSLLYSTSVQKGRLMGINRFDLLKHAGCDSETIKGKNVSEIQH